MQANTFMDIFLHQFELQHNNKQVMIS